MTSKNWSADVTAQLLNPNSGSGIANEKVKINSAQRAGEVQPFVLLVDVSNSMNLGTPPDIDQVNMAVRNFLRDMKDPPDAALKAMNARIVTAIYAYSTDDADRAEVKEVLGWTDGEKLEPSEVPALVADGWTPTAHALNYVANEVYRLIKRYREEGITFSQVKVIHMTDGAPTDMWFNEHSQGLNQTGTNPKALFRNWEESQAHWRYLVNPPGLKRGFAELAHIVTRRGYEVCGNVDGENVNGVEILKKHSQEFSEVFKLEPGQTFSDLIEFVYQSVSQASMTASTLTEALKNCGMGALTPVNEGFGGAVQDADPHATIARVRGMEVGSPSAVDVAPSVEASDDTGPRKQTRRKAGNGGETVVFDPSKTAPHVGKKVLAS